MISIELKYKFQNPLIFNDIQFFPQCEEEEVAQASTDADFILAPFHSPPIMAKIISSAKSLKLTQQCGSGYNTVNLEAADKAGVPVRP